VGVPGLSVMAPFEFEDSALESDGVHLNAEAGTKFLEIVSKALSPVPPPSLPPPSDNVIPIDVGSGSEEEVADVDSQSDSDDVSDSNRLSSILKIVKGNSRLLSAVKPLRESVASFSQRTLDLESSVRLRRQQDNYVFARMKEDSDAELNKSREDRVVISGLDRAPASHGSHQEKKEYFRGVVARLVELACPSLTPASIKEVFVTIRRDQLSPVVEARFDTISNASAFRKAASTLAKEKDPEFGHLFFANSVTQATRVRIEIMRAIAKKLTTDIEAAYVQGFISRPKMHYVVNEGMASECSGVGRSYSFVDAVSRFGDLLMPADLSSAYKRAGNTFKGSMEHYFILLSEGVLNANLQPLGTRGSSRGRPRGAPSRRPSRGVPRIARSSSLFSRKRPSASAPDTPSKRRNDVAME